MGLFRGSMRQLGGTNVKDFSWLRALVVALACTAATTHLPAQTGSVEDDAQEFTRLVLRHDRLVLKNNMDRTMSPAELAEMGRLRAALEKIKTAYTSGALRSSSAAYQKRVKELSVEVVAPAVKRWVAEEFPEPKAVAAVYTDELQCSAAMQVLHRVLNEKAGQPPNADVTAKLRRYETAWMKINAHSRSDYSERLTAIEKSMWNKKFQFEVLAKFVPLYSVEAGNAAGKIQFDTDLATAKARVRSASYSLALLILALPLIYLFLGQRSAHHGMPRNPDETYPLQLPRSLETVDVFRKRIEVEFVCGKVTDKSTIVETTKWTRFTQGQTRQSGPWTFKDPDTFSTHTSTTTYYKYSLETPDGGTKTLQTVWRPTDLEIGQLFSMVMSRNHVLMYHNHTKGDRAWEGDGLSEVLSMPPGFLFWVASMTVAVAGSLAIQRMLVTGVLLGESAYETVVGMTAFATAPLAGIYIAFLRSKIRSIRERQFLKTWAPKFQTFMESATPAMTKRFSGDERARARLERRLEQQRAKT